MIGQIDENKKTSSDEAEVFQLNYTKHSKYGFRIMEVELGSSQVVVFPDVIADMLDFVKVVPNSYKTNVSTLLAPALHIRKPRAFIAGGCNGR